MNNAGFCEFPHVLAQAWAGFLGQFLKALQPGISHPCVNLPNIPDGPTASGEGTPRISGPLVGAGSFLPLSSETLSINDSTLPGEKLGHHD